MRFWQRPYAVILHWRVRELRSRIRELSREILDHEADIQRLELLRESVYATLISVDSKLEKLEK